MLQRQLSHLYGRKLEHLQIIYKDPVRTLQETHCVSPTKPNRLTAFGKTVAVYWENYTRHTNALCGQNAEANMLKQVVHIVTTRL
jgi:hypothetical protein